MMSNCTFDNKKLQSKIFKNLLALIHSFGSIQLEENYTVGCDMGQKLYQKFWKMWNIFAIAYSITKVQEK